MAETPEIEARKYGGGTIPVELESDLLRSEFVMVTPALAEVWLERNTHNRPYSARKAELFAVDMGSDAWTVGATAIAFSDKGVLMNGQTRLGACIIAGRPFPAVVIYNLGSHNFKNMDAAPGRTLQDRLALGKEDVRQILGPSMVWLRLHERGLMSSGNSSRRMTPDEEEQLLERHPNLRESAKFIRDAKCTAVGNRGMLAAFHYICRQLDPTLADYFYECLGTGTGMMRKTEPVYLLYQQLSEDKSQRDGRRMLRPKKAALCIKAWNLTVVDRPIKVLSWRRTEGFPTFEAP